MITVEEVTALIAREIRGKVLEETTVDETTELDALGLSSLQVTEIVFTLEEEHGVEFDAAKAADARTVGDLVTVGNEALRAVDS